MMRSPGIFKDRILTVESDLQNFYYDTCGCLFTSVTFYLYTLGPITHNSVGGRRVLVTHDKTAEHSHHEVQTWKKL